MGIFILSHLQETVVSAKKVVKVASLYCAGSYNYFIHQQLT